MEYGKYREVPGLFRRLGLLRFVAAAGGVRLAAGRAALCTGCEGGAEAAGRDYDWRQFRPL